MNSLPPYIKDQITLIEKDINRALDARDLPTYLHKVMKHYKENPVALNLLLHSLFAQSGIRGPRVLAQTAGMLRDISEQYGMIEMVEVAIIQVSEEASKHIMGAAFDRVSSLCAALNVPNPVFMADPETGGELPDPNYAREAQEDAELRDESDQPEWARGVTGSVH